MANPVITLNGDAEVLLTVAQASSWSDPGATASDAEDGSVTVDVISTFQASEGVWRIYYNATDLDGNRAETKVRVVIVAQEAAGIDSYEVRVTPNGQSAYTITGIVEPAHTLTGLDPSTSHDWEVRAEYQGAYSEWTAPRTFSTAADTTKPVITLLGPDPDYVTTGDAWTDPGADVTDNVDPDTTITGDTAGLDTNTPGTYSIPYDYTDAAGNAADTVYRDVIVQDPDTTDPVVTLNGESTVYLTESQVAGWTDPGATATDNRDATVTDLSPIQGTVGSTAGYYYLSYRYTDAAGNVSNTAVRKVVVASEIASDQFTVEWREVGGSTNTDVVAAPPHSISLVPGKDWEWRVRGEDSGSGATSQFTSWNTFSTPAIGGSAGHQAEPASQTASTPDGGITATASHQAESAGGSGSGSITPPIGGSASHQAEPATQSATSFSGTAPVIELLGDQIIHLDPNDPWTDPGVQIIDDQDGDISDQVVITGTVDTATPGTYKLRYDVTNSGGLSAAPRYRYVAVNQPTAGSAWDLEYRQAGGSVTQVQDLGSPNYSVTGQNPGREQQWRVRAKDGGVLSSWTAWQSYWTDLVYALTPQVSGEGFIELNVTVSDATVDYHGDIVITGTCNRDDALITLTLDGSTYKTYAVGGTWTITLEFERHGHLLMDHKDELITGVRWLLEGDAQDTGTDTLLIGDNSYGG